MRYCPNCRRINESWPERCRFCGLTWNIRFCKRGHPNPINAVFCGECGSGDLTAVARGGRFLNGIFRYFHGGRIFPFIMLMIKLALPVLVICVIAQNVEAFIPALIALTVFFGILKYAFDLVGSAFGIFPSWLTGQLTNYFRDRIKDHKDHAKRRDSRGK